MHMRDIVCARVCVRGNWRRAPCVRMRVVIYESGIFCMRKPRLWRARRSFKPENSVHPQRNGRMTSLEAENKKKKHKLDTTENPVFTL